MNDMERAAYEDAETEEERELSRRITLCIEKLKGLEPPTPRRPRDERLKWMRKAAADLERRVLDLTGEDP